MNCQQCQKWKVKNANFCWYCGLAFHNNRFETELITARPQFQISKQITDTLLILGISYLGVQFWLDWPPALSMVPPLVYLIGRPFLETYLNAPKKDPEPEHTTLKVEYRSEDKRHWTIDNYPAEISLQHLRYVAQIVIVEGGKFSRRSITKNSPVTQTQYDILRQYWIKNNLLVVTANNHNVLTPRCQKLLKKTLPSPT
jgi:hypothetical protein